MTGSYLIFENLSGEEPGDSRGRLVRVMVGPVPVEILITVMCHVWSSLDITRLSHKTAEPIDKGGPSQV